MIPNVYCMDTQRYVLCCHSERFPRCFFLPYRSLVHLKHASMRCVCDLPASARYVNGMCCMVTLYALYEHKLCTYVLCGHSERFPFFLPYRSLVRLENSSKRCLCDIPTITRDVKGSSSSMPALLLLGVTLFSRLVVAAVAAAILVVVVVVAAQ